VAAAAGGAYHSLALKGDGTVVAWGAGTNNTGNIPQYGQAVVPAGLNNVVAVAAGAYHSLALSAEGTVAAWGAGLSNTGSPPDYGQSLVPANLSNVVAIAAGRYHSLALRADGTVSAWGAGQTYSGSVPNFGQCLVPADLSNVVAIAADYYGSVALKSDGSVVVWGAGTNNTGTSPQYGQAIVPKGLTNVISVAGGGFHNLVLENDGRPVLTVQPASQTAAAGATVVYTAMALGNQPLTYQWQLNGTDLPGATAAVLSLTNIQHDNAGTYTLNISNTVGSAVSSGAALAVLSPPTITAQPVDQIVITGASATFSVQASGTPPLGYQWQFNGADIAGATDSSYNLVSVQATNAGTYSAAVSNPYGVTPSSNAVLTVVVPPVITAQPSNQTVVAGADVSFTVQAAGSAPLDYQWYFGQTNLLAGADSEVLSLTNVQPAQAGDYYVIVDNVAGSVTSMVRTLTILVPSDILSGASYSAAGVFQVNVGGNAGGNYVVSSSTNLVDWTPLQTNTSPFTFTDTNAANVPLQFYRAQLIP
jgi:hypothetical protein